MLVSRFDWIYLDPSRRNNSKGKVFRLSDSMPNVLEHLELLLSKTDNILLKTSPLLDFSIGVAELKFVQQIHVVAVNNEVKELLWLLKKEYMGQITVKTINYSKTGAETFNFELSEEKKVVPRFSRPLSYIYEPNAAILKSGAFKLTGAYFGLNKLHEHTHLYTSEESIAFPGRRFKLDQVVPYTKKDVKSLGIKKANISTKNFPESVSDIRKKFKIADGGTQYLLCITDSNEKRKVLCCSKK